MITCDLLYVLYINNICIYKSGRDEYSDSEDVLVLQMEGGQRIGEQIRRGFEENPGPRPNGLRYRLYLANPDRSDQYYADNRNSPDLIELNVNATAGEVRRVSDRHFGVARKPLVVLQISDFE